VVLPDTADATIADLARVQPLDTLLAPLRQQWLLDLIVQDRLTSYFQPIVDISQPTCVHGFECLLRGRELNGDIVSPTAMFDVARETGSLSQLDRIAGTMAIRCSSRNQIAESIFINLNPCTSTFSGPYLHDLVEEAFEAGIPCERITFEIVETDRVGDLTALQKAIEDFRKYSFKIALDDVGAGYNGLNLLARIKPDLIKLDVDLVRNVDSDPYKAEISSKLLEAAQNLGVETIAEGIETEAEWKWFWEHGADYGQGFAFARPGPTPPSPQVPVGAVLCA
jgi:EAL domain-containing protein (putative c-di-GMP-specific phosphodiesterase class I)